MTGKEKVWLFSTCNGSNWGPIQLFMDLIATQEDIKPDFYAVQEHRIEDDDRLKGMGAAGRLRKLKLNLTAAQKTVEHVLATSGGTGVACRSHIGRKCWPKYQEFF